MQHKSSSVTFVATFYIYRSNKFANDICNGNYGFNAIVLMLLIIINYTIIQKAIHEPYNVTRIDAPASKWKISQYFYCTINSFIIFVRKSVSNILPIISSQTLKIYILQIDGKNTRVIVLRYLSVKNNYEVLIRFVPPGSQFN